jgi:hypothetical protein
MKCNEREHNTRRITPVTFALEFQVWNTSYEKQAAALDPTTTTTTITRVEEEEESGEKFTSQNPRYTCEGFITSTTLGFWV